MRFCMGKAPIVTMAGFTTYYSLTCKPSETAKKKKKRKKLNAYTLSPVAQW